MLESCGLIVLIVEGVAAVSCYVKRPSGIDKAMLEFLKQLVEANYSVRFSNLESIHLFENHFGGSWPSLLVFRLRSHVRSRARFLPRALHNVISGKCPKRSSGPLASLSIAG